MSRAVNLQNDLNVLNATPKQEHPDGVLLTWEYKGKALRNVYPQLKINEISHWGKSVREFVESVDRDEELRAKRDRELAAAEKENPSPTVPPARPKPAPGAEPPANPLEMLERQLEDAKNAALAAKQQLVLAETASTAADQHVAMLEAAVEAMKLVQGGKHESQKPDETGTAAKTRKHPRKKRSKKKSVQGSASSAQDSETGAGDSSARNGEGAEPERRSGGGSQETRQGGEQ